MKMRTLMLRHRDKSSQFVSRELCGIKSDGSPKRLVEFLQKEGIMQGTPKDVQKMWDDLWSCGMWVGEGSAVVLYLDKWEDWVMQYFGGKAKISKPLAAYINCMLKPEQPFVDAFCGSCNVLSKIDSNRIRYGNDLHPELIEMWKHAVSGGDFPTEISEQEYQDVKQGFYKGDVAPMWLKAFVGFGCSFAGKWWGGYARGGDGRNYCLNALSGVMKKSATLSNIVFTQGSYYDHTYPKGSLIYCDIPYRNTTGYSVGSFDHKKFYSWACFMVGQGHDILVSEYAKNVPVGWEVVWQLDSKKDIRNANGEREPTTEVLMRPTITHLPHNSV